MPDQHDQHHDIALTVSIKRGYVTVDATSEAFADRQRRILAVEASSRPLKGLHTMEVTPSRFSTGTSETGFSRIKDWIKSDAYLLNTPAC